MAPIDRQERRLQKRRGAGPTNVVANFAFDIAALAAQAKATKQSSLPPQSSRRTPTSVNKTPRGLNSSAKRHRSASIHRSSSVKRKATPKTPVITPQLGKRKRGSKDAQVLEDDGEPDELSPDHQDSEVHSIERARKIVGTASPSHEETNDEPDELSAFLEEGVGSLRKSKTGPALIVGVTPVKTSEPPRSAQEKTSDSRGAKSLSMRSRLPPRRSKSTEIPPETPSALPNGRQSLSSTRPTDLANSNVALDGDGMTPAQDYSTPRVDGEQSIAKVTLQGNDALDELSPEHPASTRNTPRLRSQEEDNLDELSPEHPEQAVHARRGRPKRIVVDEEDVVQSTPAASKPRQKKTSLVVQESPEAEDSLDELSPEADRARQRPARQNQMDKPARHQEDLADAEDYLDELSPDASRTRKLPAKQKQTADLALRQEEPVDVSSAGESDQYEPEQEEEPTMRVSPISKQKPVKRTSDQPPRKRAKLSGLKQAISVMRIKGSTVKGITVADTTRTILEENIDHRVQQIAEKIQSAEASSRRKKLRTEANLTLAFQESLNEKLMDLQDANDSLSANFKRRRLLRHGNVERRKEILRIQNSRHELALEMDDERAAFETEKAKVEARSKLSANMFEIQAAVQSGREHARRQGREDEGPERPLSMLLDTVGRHVGSVGGGLLATIQHFNDGLEKAAGWLEGRA
ncbi:hypothetical protein N0V90_008506 [Kalmusia sp. IMI 367209]|nr:hypothetical protein N0V90_008506 [Kalmusia sp. IMI 367209]